MLVSWLFFFWISFQKGLSCPPQCRVWAFSLCFLYFFWLSIITSVVFTRSSNLLDPLDFFLSCPSFAWAALIIEFFRTCPPSVGCDPSQGYFQKCNRLKMGLQRIYFSLVKGLSKMAFPHLKCMHLGAVNLAFMRVCKVIIHSNKTQLWSHFMVFFCFCFCFCFSSFLGVWLPF